MKLENDQHERFCQEYLVDLNQTQAAIRAKFSKKTAAQQASRLLTKVNIQERIAELKAERSKRTHISQDRVLKELAMIGFSDLRNYITIDELTGAITAKGFDQMPEGESRVLKSIREDRVIKEDADGKKATVYDKVKFELYDKPKALDMIGRHLGMFVEPGDKIADVLYNLSEKFLPKVDDEALPSGPLRNPKCRKCGLYKYAENPCKCNEKP